MVQDYTQWMFKKVDLLFLCIFKRIAIDNTEPFVYNFALINLIIVEQCRGVAQYG